jgi:predicted Zn-dependent protease
VSLSEKEKELIRESAELDKAKALAEQRIQYTATKLKEVEDKVDSLNNENYKAMRKIDEKDLIIAVLNYNYYRN